MKLETKRLILRPARKSDWKAIVEGVGGLSFSTLSHPYKKKDAFQWINKNLKSWRKKKKREYGFVIELKAEKKVVGGTGLHKVDSRNGIAETGSWVARKYRRQGIVTEAKIAVNDFAFNKLKLRRLVSLTRADNLASNKIQRKFGLKLEGTLRKDHKDLATGKIHDTRIYGLLKDEWKKSRMKLLKGKLK